MENDFYIAFLRLLLLSFLGGPCLAQPLNFIHSDTSKAQTEFITRVSELSDGSFVFCGSQKLLVQNAPASSNGMLLKTNAGGRLLSKKILSKPLYTNRDFPFGVFQHGKNLILLSTQDSTAPVDFYTRLNRLSWRLLDTDLNVITEKIIPLDLTGYEIRSVDAVQVADTTFVSCLFQSIYIGVSKCALLTLDNDGNTIAFKYTDSSFFGYPDHANIDYISAIEKTPLAGNHPGTAVISCTGTLKEKIVYGSEKFLIAVDAHLNVVDTLDMSAPLMPLPADTFLSYGNWEVLPLANSNYAVRGGFGFGVNTNGAGELPGLGRYNAITGKYESRRLIGSQNYVGFGINEVSGKRFVRAGNFYYFFGQSQGISYMAPENSWVLVQFDTALNGLRTFSFDSPGYEYSATHIEALKDGGVLMVGSRSLIAPASNTLQREYLAVRLDSAGNTLSIPEVSASNPAPLRFAVVPNPSVGRFSVKDTKGQLQEVRIYDLQGRLIRRQEAQGSSANILITDQPAGVYILQIQTTDGVVEPMRLLLQ